MRKLSPANSRPAIPMCSFVRKNLQLPPCEQQVSLFSLLSPIPMREMPGLREQVPVETHRQVVSEESFELRLLVGLMQFREAAFAVSREQMSSLGPSSLSQMCPAHSWGGSGTLQYPDKHPASLSRSRWHQPGPGTAPLTSCFSFSSRALQHPSD